MKLRLKKHTTRVLIGESARAWLEKHRPESAHWATTVAVCSCGWSSPTIHGEAAERLAEEHLA